MNLRSTVEQVTPALAAAWLEHNHKQNRPVREHRVRMYAAEMIAGRWLTTHQGIAFDADGHLPNTPSTALVLVESPSK